MSSIQTYNSDNAEWGYVNNATEGPFYIKVLAALPLASRGFVPRGIGKSPLYIESFIRYS